MAVYGTHVTLDCNVMRDNNLEVVHVYWTKVFDRGLIQMNAGYSGTEGMTMEDPSLTITFPTFDDTAQYICAAKSQESNITGEPINLIVIGGRFCNWEHINNEKISLFGDTAAQF